MRITFLKHTFEDRELLSQDHCPRIGDRIVIIDKDKSRETMCGTVAKVAWEMESYHAPSITITLV